MKTLRSTTLQRLACAGAAALSLACASTAGAAGSSAPATVTVRYGDLNLGTDAGLQTLYARLQRAAEQVCPDSHDRSLERATRARACEAAAVDAAVERVHSPRLAALHAQHLRAG